MRTFGLIGFPLTHSFSSQYFSEKFESEKISDAEYKHFPLKTIDELPSLIESTPQLKGLNVTIPYKEAVIPFLDELDGEAEAIGAVNTIKISRQSAVGSRQTHLKGFNTDVYGFRESLKPLLQAHHKKALVLGTGGGAKAVGYVLKQLGIECVFVSRTAPPRPSLWRGGRGVGLFYNDLNEDTLNTHYLIINATPLGMHPNTETHPNIPYEHLTERHLLYDLVYNPGETTFLKLGRQRGAVTKNGLEMLRLQAEKSWEIWNA